MSDYPESSRASPGRNVKVKIETVRTPEGPDHLGFATVNAVERVFRVPWVVSTRAGLRCSDPHRSLEARPIKKGDFCRIIAMGLSHSQVRRFNVRTRFQIGTACYPIRR